MQCMNHSVMLFCGLQRPACVTKSLVVFYYSLSLSQLPFVSSRCLSTPSMIVFLPIILVVKLLILFCLMFMYYNMHLAQCIWKTIKGQFSRDSFLSLPFNEILNMALFQIDRLVVHLSVKKPERNGSGMANSKKQVRIIKKSVAWNTNLENRFLPMFRMARSVPLGSGPCLKVGEWSLKLKGNRLSCGSALWRLFSIVSVN